MLHVILARCFGMPPQAAMSWLLGSHLVELVTPPEWQFVMGGKGDHRSFVLHHDALFALAWVLGLSQAARPDRRRSTSGWWSGCRTCRAGRRSASGGPGSWPRRSTRPTRPPCSTCTTAWTGRTWRPSGSGRRLPGLVDANAIGQRRWALEWAVILRGPYHDEPPGWEEVDLST